MSKKNKSRGPVQKKPLLNPEVRDWIRTYAQVVMAIASLVIAYTSVAALIVLQHWVDKGDSAWTAPWINVINRGPVQ